MWTCTEPVHQAMVKEEATVKVEATAKAEI